MFLETFIPYLAAAVPAFLLGLYIGRDTSRTQNTSHNTAMVQFTSEQLYSAAKDAGLHNVDIDDLIEVIGKQNQ